MRVEIVPYKESWSNEYEKIVEPVRERLGSLVARIDHIGSTSIPNLAAKDRIDIQLSIASPADFDAVTQALTKMGFVNRPQLNCDHVQAGCNPDPSEWEKRFFKTPDEQRAVNLHVRIAGKANMKYALLFRDYLRANRNAALAYEQVKQQLALYHADTPDVYSDIKDPVCDVIMCAAKAWAEQTNWKLDQ